MSYCLDDPFSSPHRLSQSLVQASEALGLSRAEMGRILGLRCEQFTALFEGRSLLQEGSHAWLQAVLFVRLYHALSARMDGNRVKMNNWLRRELKALGNSPFYLMVDEGRLAEVVRYLEPGESRP